MGGKDAALFRTDFPYHGWIVTPLIPSLIVPVKVERNVACQPHQFHEHIDFVGGDMFESPTLTKSARECCALCSATVGCIHFTQTPEGHCWLKGVAEFKRSDMLLISGTVSRRTRARAPVSPDLPPRTDREDVKCCSMHANLNKSFTFSEGSGLENICCCMSSNNQKPLVFHLKRSSTGWTEQWPLGNGKFGAMVGGSIDSEVIPLSIANLFFLKKSDRGSTGKRRAKEIKEAFYSGESFRTTIN